MTERHSSFSSDEVLAVERRAVASSIAGGAARSALRAGDKMPMFVLPDTDGKETGARELLARGPLIVLFLRGAWCSYSIRNGKAVEGLRSEIGRRSASVVGVSQQNAQHGRKMKRQNDLGFPLLVDSGGGVAAQFGVKWTVPGCLRESYERVGIDLARYQGEGWTLPIPSMFVAGSDGAIAFAEVDPDFTRLLDFASVLPVLDRLRIWAVGGQPGNGWFQEAVWAKNRTRTEKYDDNIGRDEIRAEDRSGFACRGEQRG